MEINNSNNISNSGYNSGNLVGVVNGDIVYNLEPYKKTTSLILNLVKALSELISDYDDEDERELITYKDVQPYEIPLKLKFNCVIKYKDIIEEYSKYEVLCEQAFNSIDNNNMGVKKRVLKRIKLFYSEIRGDLILKNKENKLSKIEIIRNNSDKIICSVKEELKQIIYSDPKVKCMFQEDIDIGLYAVTCYAFIKCKILEKPR